MNILFLTTVLPSGRFGGGEIWSQSIIDACRAAGHRVQVLGYDRRGGPAGEGESAVAQRIVESSLAPRSALRWGAHAVLKSRPYTVEKWIGKEYRRTLSRLLAAEAWDLAVLDHAGSGWAMEELGRLPFVHLSHQAESALYQTQGRSARFPFLYRREARLVRSVEARLTREAVETWTISSEDAEYFRSLGGRIVRTLPVVGRPCHAKTINAKPGAGAADVGLLGSWTWKANRDALLWFIKGVLPLLPSEWEIVVGGKYSKRHFPICSNLRFTGVVQDPFAFLAGVHRIAVPAFPQTGVPIKLLDAIASGRPVVTTGTALKRIGEQPPHVRSADDARSFADALISTRVCDQGCEESWAAERQSRLEKEVAKSLESLRPVERPRA